MSEEKMEFSQEEFHEDGVTRTKAILAHLDQEMTKTIDAAYKTKCSQEAEACLKKFYIQYRSQPWLEEKDEQIKEIIDEQIKKIISVYAGMVTYNDEKIFSDDTKTQIEEHWDSWIVDSEQLEQTKRISDGKTVHKKQEKGRENHKNTSIRSVAIALIGGLLIGLILGWIIGYTGSRKDSDEPTVGSAIATEQGSAVVDNGDGTEGSEDNMIDTGKTNPEQGTSSGVVSVGGSQKDVTAVLLQAVNLREEASSESEWIMRLDEDQEITILGEEHDGWIQISVENSEGKMITGFIRTILNDEEVYQVNYSNG